MGKNKLKLQTLIFSKNSFNNRGVIKSWIKNNNFSIDMRLKQPIMKTERTFRVRQRNPDWFVKSSFRVKPIGKGIKGVFGYLKKS